MCDEDFLMAGAGCIVEKKGREGRNRKYDGDDKCRTRYSKQKTEVDRVLGHS